MSRMYKHQEFVRYTHLTSEHVTYKHKVCQLTAVPAQSRLSTSPVDVIQ